MRRTLAVLAAAAMSVALAGCGGGSDEASTTATSPATTAAPATTATTTETATETDTVTTETETETETETQSETETQAGTENGATTQGQDAAGTVIRVVGGEPQGGIAQIETTKGERVHIEVEVDAPDELHLHGYDIEKEATPAKPAVFDFKAEFEGIFELESHDSGTLLAEITVTP
jgi:hypothetical protein